MLIPLTITSPVIEEFLGQMKEINLTHRASEAACLMKFENAAELGEAVKRAMELCRQAGLPLEMNFRRIYQVSGEGIVCDWKVSLLGYYLICLNGSPGNPFVAGLQVEMIKKVYSNSELPE